MPHLAQLPAEDRPDAVAGIVGAVVHRNRPIHHGADALAHAPGRMRLHVPDGREDLQHVGARDLRDRTPSDAREGIALKTAQPCSGVCRVAPSCPLLLDDKRSGDGEGGHGLGAPPLSERIAARARDLAVGAGDGAGLGERDRIYAAESEFALPAADDEPLNPAPGSGRLDEQVEAVAVTVSSRRGVSDEGGRECVSGVPAARLGLSRLGEWVRDTLHPPIIYVNGVDGPGRSGLFSPRA